MIPLIDTLTRTGLPRSFVKPGATGVTRYHGHSFDFGRFTRIGSDLNVPVEVLAEGFSRFYQQLPASCPICRERQGRPVEVTLIGRSFGGLISREFLLGQAQKEPVTAGPLAEVDLTPRWTVTQVITLGSPYFGSIKTRFTTGFLSVVINGLVRTLVMGFTAPERGGSFGKVIDEQARAMRVGSPYLWNAHLRWAEWVHQQLASDRNVPQWLVIAGVGHHDVDLKGDGVTRFTSANLAPLLPNAPMETLVGDVLHRDLFREEERGSSGREMAVLSRAMGLFLARGTLKADPTSFIEPRTLNLGTRTQTIYWQAPAPPGSPDARDRIRKDKDLRRLEEISRCDVWLRFYDNFPGRVSPPGILTLRAALSFFQGGVEPSRSWMDLLSDTEEDPSGNIIPTVQSMAPSRSHLITLPDLSPAGPYLLRIRIALPGRPRGLVLPSARLKVKIEGGSCAVTHPPAISPNFPVCFQSRQANLVHVYLDGAGLMQEYPELQALEIREVSLTPEPQP